VTWLAVDMYDRERWSVVCPEHESRQLWVHCVIDGLEAGRAGIPLEVVLPDASAAVVEGVLHLTRALREAENAELEVARRKR